MTDPRDALVLRIEGKTGATIFLKLNSLYPECEFLINDLQHLAPLHCLQAEFCPRNQNCMENLVARIRYLFDTFPDAQAVLLYFRYRDRPGSHRAGVFWRDMREPRLITFNRAAWEKCKQIGTVLAWRLPDELFLQSGTSQSKPLYALRTSSRP
jgi:hypothetical protein